MKRLFAVIIVLLAVLILSGCTIRVILSGDVLDGKGNGVPGVKVTIVDPVRQRTYERETDASGKWELNQEFKTEDYSETEIKQYKALNNVTLQPMYFKEGYKFESINTEESIPFTNPYVSRFKATARYAVDFYVKVQDASGMPLEGVRLKLYMEKGNPLPYREFTTDKSGEVRGQYVSDTVVADDFKMYLVAEKEGWHFPDDPPNYKDENHSYVRIGYFFVSGKALDEKNVGVANVKVTAVNESDKKVLAEALTNEKGEYSFEPKLPLPASFFGFTGTVKLSASKAGYQFTPILGGLPISAPRTGYDFFANKLFDANGYVRDGLGAGIEGVVIRYDGSTVSTDKEGYYSIPGLDRDILVRPEKAGFTFTPESMMLTKQTGMANFLGRFAITGSIKNSLGAPLQGLGVVYNGTIYKTDANGIFTITGIDRKFILSAAENPGYAIAPSGIEVGGPNTVPTFTAKYSVSGKVTDAAGKGMEGVTVSFGSINSVTAPDGSFTLSGLDGAGSILPQKAGYVFSPGPISVGGPTAGVNFKAEFGVTGRVADANGKGIPGVEIKAGLGTTSTDDDGTFRIAGIGTGVEIVPYKHGFAFSPSKLLVVSPYDKPDFIGTYSIKGSILDAYGSGVAGVLVIAGAQSGITKEDGSYIIGGISGSVNVVPQKKSVDFTPESFPVSGPTNLDFMASLSIAGRVVDGAGKGVAGVTIRSGQQRVQTGPDGGYSLKGLVGSVTVVPIKEGYSFVPSVLEINKDTKDYDFEAAFSITGFVKDAQGKGIQGIEFKYGGVTYRTDINGKFGITNVSEEFVLQSADSGGYSLLPQSIRISGPTGAANFEARYDVKGRIAMKDGTGVEGVDLIADGKKAVTSKDGSYSINGISGLSQISPEKTGYTFTPGTFAVSGPTAGLDFLAEFSVQGKIVDAMDKAIPGVLVAAGDKKTITAPDGSFTIMGLDGAVVVMASKDGYDFEPKEIRTSVPISSAPFRGEYRISGRVVDAYGNGVPEVILSAGTVSVKTGADGSYTLKGLSGNVKIVPEKAGTQFSPESVMASEPSKSADFLSSYSLYGKVTDYSGTAIEGAVVSAGQKSAATGPDGSYKISGFFGRVNLVPNKDGYIFQPSSTDVVAETREYNFKGSFGISGLVKNAEGKGIQGIVFNYNGNRYPTDLNGRFSISGIMGAFELYPEPNSGYVFTPQGIQVSGPTGGLVFEAQYGISGKVTDAKGRGIQGVMMSYGDKVAMTREDGSYAIVGISGAGNVLPSKDGYVFIPSSISIAGPMSNLDFSAEFRISGKITDTDNRGVSGVTVSAGQKRAITSSDGSYVISGLVEPVQVVPKKEGYDFMPSSFDVSEPMADRDFLASYSVRGKIIDSFGRGIAAVSINVGSLRTVTADDGSYAIAGLSGNVKVVPVKDGYSFTPTYRDAYEPAERVDFVSSHSAAGKVTDSSGKGISGVSVTSGQRNTITNADGAYILQGLFGKDPIVPSKEGYSFSPAALGMEVDAKSYDFKGGFEISGFVRDTQGSGVQGIIFKYNGTNYTTDVSGKFRIPMIGSGFTLVPEPNTGYVFSPASLNITEPNSNANFVAQYKVSGKVVDADGKGVGGVLVSFPGKEVYTDKDGAYSIVGISGMGNVVPSKEGYVFVPSAVSVAGPTFNVNFSTEFGVSGRITDRKGKAVAGVNIIAGLRRAVTTMDGSFNILGLSGSIDLVPVKEGFAFDPVSINIDGPTTKADFVADYEVSGKVLDAFYHGVPGVLVKASDKEAVTDENGYYRIAGLSGSTKIVPQKQGYAFLPESISTVDPSRETNFMSTYSISGKVTDPNGSGVSGVTVSIGQKIAVTNASGTYTIAGLSGTTKVTPFKEGFAFSPPSYNISNPSDKVDFVAGYAVYGRVVDIKGNGLVDAIIRIGDKSVYTNSEGMFIIDGLIGTLEIAVMKEGYIFSLDTRAVSGSTVNLVIMGVSVTPESIMANTGATTELKKITSDGIAKAYPRLSPDGQLLAYSAVSTSPTGKHGWAIKLQPMGEPGVISINGAMGTQPAWYPDSQRIMFVMDQANIPVIVSSSISGSSWTYLSSEPEGSSDQMPDIDSSGQKVAFSTRKGNTDYLYVVPVNGWGPAQIGEGTNPRWHPEKDIIAYTIKVGGFSQIFLYDKTGGAHKVTQLTKNNSNNLFPSWSPDGEWISFVSNRDGKYHLYVMKANATSVTQLTNGNAEAFYASWGSDGMIYFVSDAGAKAQKISDPNEWVGSDVWRVKPLLPH